jgi:hypothetical protein
MEGGKGGGPLLYVGIVHFYRSFIRTKFFLAKAAQEHISCECASTPLETAKPNI